MIGTRAAARWLAALACLAIAAGPPPPEYLVVEKSGLLLYKPDPRGDRIPDFSVAGYKGGGVPIPDVPARVAVNVAAGDATSRIQSALDQVACLPADSHGIRGAVLLDRGRFEIAGTLHLKAKGVVLRGQGYGVEGTRLIATGTSRRPLIRIEGAGEPSLDPGSRLEIRDAFVPVGATRLAVDRAGIFQPGDRILVTRPSPIEWIAALGMNHFPLGYEGSLDWRAGAMDLRSDRVITRVDGTTLTLDAPLTTSMDRDFGGGRVQRYSWPGRTEQVGVENLRCESEHDPQNQLDEEHAWDAIRIDAVENAWVRRVVARGFAGSAVRIVDGARCITVLDCISEAPVSEFGGGRRHAFETSGQLTLFLRCRSEKGRHDFTVGALSPGPNAFVSCEATDAQGFSGPHGSWASGTLYDNVRIDGAGLALTNRETDGQGTGWASANGVLWQCSASTVTCREPPGAHNWAIGCWGQFYGDGEWQAPNEFVKPDSLYRAQLAERLGPNALKALEPNEIKVASRPPTLEDHGRVTTPAPEAVSHRLEIKNGWLTIDGALLSGGRVGTTWWRGSPLPTRARDFGLGVTRFVPGRDGPGLTDDPGGLADDLRRDGTAVLEHHWGLWYDRRRDDHQMIRRIDGDVWPPFYEQPWARSGQDRAWDGLSKYDLSRFNPWYFDRLREFAGHCERTGRVLFHRAYFQHNILEAGAHWADFPWRPANCLQDTGFPEPPPYSGGKRVYMADAFYDVSHPVRRALHRAYIRHCLDLLGDRPNVVFFTGEEYTGPLSFVQFWLDVMTEWERETGRDVLIGLSVTKDVQDAILADPVRGPAVSVVELKYWWYFADGTLYAPEGGRNLAPRQQLREWKGPKKRSLEQTARQVRELRERYPQKAIVFSGGPDDGWASLAAGASIPPLPAGTDHRLLKTIPRLVCQITPDPGSRNWVLADRGRDYFAYAPPGIPVRLDLRNDQARYAMRSVDPKTGRVTETDQVIEGGKIVEVPPDPNGPLVIWLTSDAKMVRPTP